MFAAFTASSQTITMSGYVKDEGSKEVLINAVVIDPITKAGTVTNEYGHFALSVRVTDTIRLVISYGGYQPYAVKIAGTEITPLDILLKRQENMLQEITVSAGKNYDNVRKAQMGVIDIPMKAVKELPVLLGERDILKIVQLLPGVQQGQEGTSGFYVRGGNLDQNLILLDEATLYNPNHLFGLFSTFNVNAVNSVRLIKGGFPAEYGGRLSSILNITMKEGDKTKYHAEAGIGLLSANLTMEGPIQKNKSSFIVSARHSYIDLLLHPLTSNTTSYAFYDLNAKINYELGVRDHLFLSAFRGNDNASYTGANSLNYNINFGNNTATIRWNHLFGSRVFSNTSLIYNDYHLQLGSTQTNYYEVLYTGIRDINAKADFTASLGTKHTTKFGINYTYHTLYPAAVSAKVPKKGNRISINKDSITQLYSNESAAYVNDDFRMWDRFSVNYGIRVPFYYAAGKAYAFVEPRITLQYALNPRTSIKASYTKMNQFVHLIPNSTASLPADVWLSSDKLLQPENSTQIALGLFKNFRDNEIEVSVEGYYKTMKNQVLFKEGTQLTLNTNIDSQLTFGKGESYGIEFFVKKSFGRLTGWFSYTLSKTTQQFPDLNFGNPFPASFDRRHNLAIVATYDFTKHWTFSADFVFSTGKPYTLPAGKVIVYGAGSLYDEYYYDYTNRNNSRMSAYNRLDISASNKKQHSFFGKFKYEREWVLGIYNVYSRQNPYFVYLTVDPVTKQPQAKQVSLLPIIPNISFNIKF
ncbi:MAG: TonB-dependent receptor [Bacteroidetes bacterium]|nr:TonB-dependent receptor [Bacteroidota bacterium]